MPSGIAQISDEIFHLLKRTGPLSLAQIAVELDLPVDVVTTSLADLSRERITEERPDHNPNLEKSWGLSSLHFRF